MSEHGRKSASNQPLEIGVLGAKDAGELLTLQRAVYVTEAAAYNDFGMPPLTQTLADLSTELASPDVTALGLRDGGRLVAAVRLRLTGTTVELGRLIVAPDRQGQGLGTRLLRYAESVFPEALQIRLFTGEHSSSNINLYTREGYSETERTSAGNYQLVHFAKQLPRESPST